MFGKISGACDAIVFGYIPRYLHRAGRVLRRNMGRILYYGAMIALLTVIAVAAESYRQKAGESPAVQADAEVIATQTDSSVRVLMLAELVPEEAQMMRAYSEQYVWNAELARWEGHMAEDYAVDEVYSLLDGKVAEVGRDGRYGGYVRIRSEACDILYASLCVDENIMPGMHVPAGMRIGYADTSMPGEAYMGQHLHMEVEAFERKLNPQTFALEIALVD